MEEGFEMYEDLTLHEVYIELVLEEWPQLASLEETARQELCTAISAALEAAECPVQAIKAKPDALHVVVKLNENLSIDDVANIVAYTANCLMAEGDETQGPESYSAEGLSPTDVIDAVMRLH